MGIHIIPKILKNKVSLDSYPPQTYWETERFDSFDSIRCSGDTDFIFESNLEWIFEYDDPKYKDFEYSYRRPKDFKKAKQWIEDNTPITNKPRLLKFMEDMIADENLWFSVSY